MRQLTADPVSTTQDTRTYGALTIHAQVTVDGGYVVNVWPAGGGPRHDELCFGTFDRDVYKLAHKTITDGAINGDHVTTIHNALVDVLTDELCRLQRRWDTPSIQRAEEINRVLDRWDSPADLAALADIADAMRECADREAADAFTALASAGRPKQLTPLKRSRPLSEQLMLIIDVARDNGGTINRSASANIRQLKALARRGLMDLNYEDAAGRRKKVVSGTLTAKALR